MDTTDTKLVRLIVLAALLTSAETGWSAGTRDLFDRSNRFLDQPFLPAALTPSLVLVDSFEDLESTKKDWDAKQVALEQTGEHVTAGRHALKAIFADASSQLRYRRGTSGWSNRIGPEETALGLRALFNDELRFDIFNPGPLVTLVVSISDESGADDVRRLEYPLPPGATTVSLSAAELRREAYRVSTIPQGLSFSLAGINSPTTLFIDNVCWVGPGLGRNLIASAKCFDFGVAACTRPFFLPVEPTTGYSKERGYGWQQPTTKPPQPWPPILADELTGRRPDDELLRDFISRAQSPFLLDLPDGTYRLHLVEHGIGFYEPSLCFYDLTLRINDGPPELLRRRAASYDECRRFEYGLDQTDWQPNDDLWRKYRGHLIRPREVDFEVRGGQVKLEFATQPRGFENLSFMIVYPLDKATVIEPELAALWRDLRHRFLEAFAPATRTMAQKLHLPGWHDELDPAARDERWAELAPSPEEIQRGYLLFHRDGIEDVYPDTVPARAECGASYEASTPPGEIESFAVSLLALRNLQGVTLEVGDFVGPGGAKIERDRVDVRTVNCLYRMTGQQSHGDWRPLVVPWHLAKRPGIDVPARTCRRFWINVDVPAQTPSGAYVATAVLSGQGLGGVEFPLRLEILPFRLDALPAEIEQSIAVPWPHWWSQLDDRLWFFIKTYVIYSHPEWFDKPENAPWKPLYDAAREHALERRKAELDLIWRYGFNRVYLAMRGLTDPPLLEGLQEHATPGLDVVRYVGEEPDDPAETALAARVSLMQRWGLPCPENQTEQAIQQRAQETKLPVLLNMNTQPLAWSDVQQEAGVYRFEAGFLLWRLGAKGAVYGPWYMPWRDPYNPFDGHISEWGDFCDPASSGPRPGLNRTLILEGLRQGIQDYRYLAMLERLVREHPPTPASRAAREHLQRLREEIQPQAGYYFQKVGRLGGWDNTWTQKETAWKGQDYRQHRRELTRHIVALLSGQEKTTRNAE